jgi:hypothetical protein
VTLDGFSRRTHASNHFVDVYITHVHSRAARISRTDTHKGGRRAARNRHTRRWMVRARQVDGTALEKCDIVHKDDHLGRGPRAHHGTRCSRSHRRHVRAVRSRCRILDSILHNHHNHEHIRNT